MKKSEMYRSLQKMLLDDKYFDYDEKLQTMRELMAQEDLAKFSEEQTEKANEAVTGG